MKKSSVLRFRIDAETKALLLEYCQRENRPLSTVMREMMAAELFRRRSALADQTGGDSGGLHQDPAAAAAMLFELQKLSSQIGSSGETGALGRVTELIGELIREVHELEGQTREPTQRPPAQYCAASNPDSDPPDQERR